MPHKFQGRATVERRSVQIRDLETGQELDMLVMARRVPHPYSKWCAVNQLALGQVAEHQDLSPCAVRLFLLAVSDLIGGNNFCLSQKEIAKRLGYSLRQVNRAWGLLLEAGIVETWDTGGFEFAGINPEIVWRGKAKGLREELKQRDLARAKRSREDRQSSTNGAEKA